MTIIRLTDPAPRVIVEKVETRVVSVGTQGPPGPAMAIPGLPGDVLFNDNTTLQVDTGEFVYSKDTRALKVRNITGTILDGGNF
jgi:hypothetical protein